MLFLVHFTCFYTHVDIAHPSAPRPVLFASLAWASEMKFYNPVLVLAIYTVVKMITAVGNDMEDPFGHDGENIHSKPKRSSLVDSDVTKHLTTFTFCVSAR